jgi:hypothetical protein
MPDLENPDGTTNFHVISRGDIMEFITISRAELDTLKGRVTQLEDDYSRLSTAAGKAYRTLVIEARGQEIPLIVLKEVMQDLESALRILPGYWPG